MIRDRQTLEGEDGELLAPVPKALDNTLYAV
jgi:hypothetical protein